MKKIITFIILVSISLLNSIWAQPVITGISAPIGTKTFGYVIPGPITQASAGANQTWDYSSIPYNAYSYYFKSIDYATLSPTMKANFPTGTVGNEVYFGNSLAITQVFQLTSTNYSYLGYDNTVFAVPDIQLTFPHSYLETKAGFTYDAYGTLKTPFGTYANTVRLKEIDGPDYKYDFWQFSPEYKLLLEYKVNITTNAISGQTFYTTEFPLNVIDSKSVSEVKLFPNPNNGKFTISCYDGSINTIEIYNMIGVKVYTSSIIKEQNEIDLSNFSKGVYLVNTKGDKKMEAIKIIVQ